MAVKKKDIPEVSSKNTKEKILSAYNEVVELLQENQTKSPQEEKKKFDEREVLNTSSQLSLEGIVSKLGGLKITLTKTIDTLSENLGEEFHKLSNLKQAIAIEQRHLQELYDINETAHTLSAIMLVQKETQEKFELEMKDKREQFEKEMADKKVLWDKKRIDIPALNENV